MNTLAPSLQGIDHIHVFVANRAQAEQWYRRVLGMHRVPSLESWASDGGPLTIGDPSGTVHLALFERPAQKCRSTIALSVSAAAFFAWRDHLSGALGHEVKVVDHQMSWSLYLEDPDGNPYEITSYEYAEIQAALGQAGG